MRPPQAKEGLVQCLAPGADCAILLTDRALAGSDTSVTARTLALTLAREQPDLILGARNRCEPIRGRALASSVQHQEGGR
jgi:electron transfer flavoprotein beta subunit